MRRLVIATVFAVSAMTLVSVPAHATTPPLSFNQASSSLVFLGIDPGTGITREPTKKALIEFQSRYELPQTGKLDKKTERKLTALAGDHSIPNRCLTGKRTACVDKRTDTVKILNPNGSVRDILHVRFGGPNYETREGTFRVLRKGTRSHVSSEYKVPMPYPVFFSGGQAIHYSYEFAGNINKDESHGCVGTRDLKAQERLWRYLRVGDPVIVIGGERR